MAKNSGKNGKRSLDRDLCVSIGGRETWWQNQKSSNTEFQICKCNQSYLFFTPWIHVNGKNESFIQKKTMTVSIIEGIIHDLISDR